jgi:Bacterial SH3 domain
MNEYCTMSIPQEIRELESARRQSARAIPVGAGFLVLAAAVLWLLQRFFTVPAAVLAIVLGFTVFALAVDIINYYGCGWRLRKLRSKHELGLFLLITWTGLVIFPLAVAAQTRLTSASNVRLRSEPATDAAIVASLPLGAELHPTAQSQDGAWIHVRTGSGPEGWVLGSLTREVPEAQYLRVAEEIIKDRLARQGDGFPARVELVAFIERSMERDGPPEARARLALVRLKALDATLETLPPSRQPWSPAMESWVRARAVEDGEIGYDEPAGQWMLMNAFIFRLHDAHRGSAVADEIAWFAVLNGLPGECENFLACMVEGTDRLDGEYLRRHPGGAHVGEAVQQIVEASGYWREGEFDPGSDCTELVTSVGSLRAAVAGIDAPAGKGILDVLDELRGRCPD